MEKENLQIKIRRLNNEKNSKKIIIEQLINKCLNINNEINITAVTESKILSCIDVQNQQFVKEIKYLNDYRNAFDEIMFQNEG